MYYDGNELRERFVADIKKIADEVREGTSHDKVGQVVKELLEYMDGTHKLSVNPMLLYVDAMEQDKINKLMMAGDQIIEDPICINTGEYLAPHFKVKRDDQKPIHE
ncbi:hypothetical protein [Pectobacterium phage vB_ParM-25]|nr:hypothetical protein [Pectobacterium phage vB_ParM-25]